MPGSYENIELDRAGSDGRVGRITLNRPEKIIGPSPPCDGRRKAGNESVNGLKRARFARLLRREEQRLGANVWEADALPEQARCRLSVRFP